MGLFAPKKVMVVDDSRLIRMTVRKILEQYGVEVSELDRVELLLDEPWRAKELDLLILDISLPGMSGVAALQQMQYSEELKSLPVMMLSAHSDRRTVVKAIEFGAVEYMTKPITSTELIKRVESILGPLRDGVRESVSNEYNRAKRGNTAFSVVKVSFRPGPTQNFLQEAKNRIVQATRSIDTVLMSRDREVVVVLPLTGPDGRAVVGDKIAQALGTAPSANNAFSLSWASFPAEADTVDGLFALLQRKQPVGSDELP